MAKLITFCFALIFGVLGVESSGLSCGGILETSRGTLEYSVLDQEAPPELCIWVINLPVPSSNIRFQLDQIPESSHLSLYPQGGQTAGQITVIPIRGCSRTATSDLRDVRPILVVMAFVNPKYQKEGNHMTLTWRKESEETITEAPPTTCSSGRLKNCAEIQRESKLSGFQVCAIYPFGSNSTAVEVMCDFETDGGGWTIIQKREKGPKEEFYRNWTDYAEGFYGNQSEGANGNYWIGLETIYALTNQNQSLRVDLTYWNDTAIFAQYSSFSISDSYANYTLKVGGFSANSSATDALSYHNGMQFSTRDRDNNGCADAYKGGWWYNNCYVSNLNGFYLNPSVNVEEDPLTGVQWNGNFFSTLQKTTSMKIRDADFTNSLSSIFEANKNLLM